MTDVTPRHNADDHRPAVTVAVPVYNGERYIRRALESVLCQDFTDFELIVSDNCSTDGTGAIVREFAARDPRVRYTRHPTNLGAIGNFLSVIDLARAERFMWLSCDNALGSSGYLRALVDGLGEHAALAFPDVDLVVTDREGRELDRKVKVFEHFRGLDGSFEMARAFARHVSHQIYGLYRLAALRRYLWLLRADASWPCFNEGRFLQALSCDETVVFVERATLLSNLRPGSVSTSAAPLALLTTCSKYFALSVRDYGLARRSARERAILTGIIVKRMVPYIAGLGATTTRQYARRAITRR